MSRKQILGLIRSLSSNALEFLKDEEYQKKIWFRKEGPQSSSYLEVVEYFISRCDMLFNNLNLKEFLGNDNYVMLKNLYDLIINHLDDAENRFVDVDLMTEHQLLDDPKWQDIQSLAEVIHVKLDKFLKEQKEVLDDNG